MAFRCNGGSVSRQSSQSVDTTEATQLAGRWSRLALVMVPETDEGASSVANGYNRRGGFDRATDQSRERASQ